jgi:aminoglycoside phosphotransferase (APT) family kinase protein
VIHLDFHPANVILSPEGEMVVIDWTGLEVTDPRIDLAWTLMIITAYEGEEWRARFLEGYEEASGSAVGEMDFFDAAAGARRLYSIAASLTAGAESLGMRPGAEEIMKGQRTAIQRVYDRTLKVTGVQMPIVEEWLEAG